jgi:hypothetical protein
MEIEESFRTIEKRRDRWVISGVLSLSISLGLFAIANFVILGLLGLTITVGLVLLILSAILFAMGLYLLIHHPIVEVEGGWTKKSQQLPSRPPHPLGRIRPNSPTRIGHIEHKNR